MKKYFVFLVSALIFSGIACADKLQLDYSLSVYDPLGRPVVEGVYCIGTTLYVNVTNHFNHRPLNNAQVTAYVNGTVVMVNTYTDYNGIALVNVKEPGLYRLRIQKPTYENVLSPLWYNFTNCTTTTTTTTTTSTTFEQTTTTEPVIITTTTQPKKTGSYVTATTVAPTCGDGIMNQDEEAVDCGGVCGPCSPVNMTTFVLAVLVIGGLGLLIFLVMKLDEKKKAEKKHRHEHNGNHDKNHHKEEKEEKQ